MLPTLRDILELIESYAPAHLAESWDNPGLQVGDRNRRIQRILLALDPTPRSLAAALNQKAQLLFTHHPLIFKPLKIIDPLTYPGNIIVEALKHRIAVVCAHTNLDAAPGGINQILAEMLGLTDVAVLRALPGEAGAGLGRIGRLAAGPALLSDLIIELKETLGARALRVVGDGARLIECIAVVGGSGGDLTALAHERGADLYVTGDVTHHKALEAAGLGLALIDAGHYCTERAALPGIRLRLQGLLAAEGWDVTVELDRVEGDPSRTV